MSLIQSNFGTKGNFEAVVKEGSQLVHYWRRNDDSVLPWYRTGVIGNNADSQAALTQSTYGVRGNFEVIVREGSKLRHYWRDNDGSGYPWHQGALFGDNVASAPALIQSRYGNTGNFEFRTQRASRHL